QFYLSAIATNHNHSTSGDHTYTQVITLTPQNIVLGDINEDGIVNILDIVQVVNLVLENEYEANGDLNSDGIINVLDIVQLVNIILN
ncbi:MAG: dockerin type I domain-containing protein, partial [Candidatus Nitrosopelagicus sp.]